MKYFDVEKLKIEIERRMDKHWEGLPDADSPEDDWTHNELCELGAYKELEHIEDFLNSLQKEPQEEICSKCIHHRKNDDCYYPYGGMQRRINENGVYECTGFCEKEQKRPEVDLEKFTEKIKTFQERYKHPEIVSIKGAMAFMARMFYQYPDVARKWYEQLPKTTMD